MCPGLPPPTDVKELPPSQINTPCPSAHQSVLLAWGISELWPRGEWRGRDSTLGRAPTLLTQGLPLIWVRGSLPEHQRAASGAQAGASGREGWQLYFIVFNVLIAINVSARGSDLLEVTLRQ